MQDYFDLSGRIAVVTGGGGMLGRQHCEAIADAGGIPIILDRAKDSGGHAARRCFEVDITDVEAVRGTLAAILKEFGRIDILINNAANNPKVEAEGTQQFSRAENFPSQQWQDDLDVGLKGAFHCSAIFGNEMARSGKGVILNIASDLSVIAPDQRLYRKEGLPDAEQPVKPVTYSVVKTGLIGLTRYFATYFAPAVRVNALSPGGVEAGQSKEFLKRISPIIPLGRMARADEYKGAVVFLCSDASSYMTGQNIIMDGGRSCW